MLKPCLKNSKKNQKYETPTHINNPMQGAVKSQSHHHSPKCPTPSLAPATLPNPIHNKNRRLDRRTRRNANPTHQSKNTTNIKNKKNTALRKTTRKNLLQKVRPRKNPKPKLHTVRARSACPNVPNVPIVLNPNRQQQYTP